ncbi:S1C family serine protease [Tessaracoccus defluvii]|nr:trypsin-like peptidase domain-containing protein [Tessaracoccus defluvii]
MSNEQHPHPWSREASQVDAPTVRQPAQPTPSPQMQAMGQPTQTPTAQQPFRVSTPPTQPLPPYGPQPMSPFGQPTAPAAVTKPKKARTGVASLVAIALLAAGVGGGAGFAAAQLGGSAGASQSTTTTVLQGDATSPDWTAVAEAASKSVVAIQVVGRTGSGGEGSGVVIDAQGHIVTNNHVVSSSGSGAQITVLLGNVSYEATVVGTDPTTDLAVIKLVDPPANLDVMPYGDSATLAVGDPVMAIGNPLGLVDTVTTGIVSALNRPVTTQAVTDNTNPVVRQNTQAVVTAAIQTNAAINPGNSGGALVNSAGELVGIPSSIATLTSSSNSESGNIGIGFAIGSDQVRYVADQLISTGKAEHPQLGVTAQDAGQTGQQGATIMAVTPDSPAEAAGLRAGDLVVSVDGAPVASTESLVALVRAGRVGEPMELVVLRNGKEETITVTPAAAAS